MSPLKREFILYLEEMQLSMDRIAEYVGELDFKKFKQTYIVVDAVIRNFEIIGEASKKIPAEIQGKYPEIPWKKCMASVILLLMNILGLTMK